MIFSRFVSRFFFFLLIFQTTLLFAGDVYWTGSAGVNWNDGANWNPHLYRHSGFLKPRTKSYLNDNRHRFYVTAIDGIVVGCVELKIIDAQTVELGALAISTRFRNQRVGMHTVRSFMALMKSQGYTRFISLTNNPRLEALYTQHGFVQQSCPEYRERQAQSPDVKMFFRKVD